jgi:hypothetical protein
MKLAFLFFEFLQGLQVDEIRDPISDPVYLVTFFAFDLILSSLERPMTNGAH